MNHLKQGLFLIDGNGPFFRGNRRTEINWSKIDFADLDAGGLIPEERCRQIEDDFRTFTRRAAAIGYNAVTLDDLAHLTDHPLYPAALRRKIAQYRGLYRRLFAAAAEAGMDVFVTTDLLFFNPAIEQITGGRPQKIQAFAAACCRQFFEQFPEAAGIIFRIGESDGMDVSGDFQSRLVLQTPRQARAMLRTLLPVFEQNHALLIFRTWTVGVCRLGDLIWNRDTFHRVFDDIHSPNLILSMKHGESDFFRYLPLNRLFFESDHLKLVELQARREYEGFGQFPSFIGHDYEKIRRELAFARNLAGISVWCQTGGWSGFRRLTLLEDDGLWNEINTFVTLRMFRDRLSAVQAVQAFCKEHPARISQAALQELLDLSDGVIKNLLYIDDFATRRIFFRRLRLPTDDFEFQYDTFRLIAAARAYYFLDHPERTLRLLQKMKERYEAKWPEPRYAVQMDLKPFPLRRVHLHRVIRILFRKQSGYRMLDRVLALTLYSLLQPLIRRVNRSLFPDFARTQAMGIGSVFK